MFVVLFFLKKMVWGGLGVVLPGLIMFFWVVLVGLFMNVYKFLGFAKREAQSQQSGTILQENQARLDLISSHSVFQR